MNEIKKAIDYFNQGYELLMQKDYEHARTNFTEVLKLEPNNDAAHFNRGLCLLNIGGDNWWGYWQVAFFDFKEAVRINPINPKYRKIYSDFKRPFFYIIFIGIIRIILRFVAPGIAAIIGGIIGSKSGGPIRTVLGGVIGASIVGLIGYLILVLIGWVGNKKFGFNFDLQKMGESGYDATDPEAPFF
ncbi:hypothetical protein AGMMS50293_28700 [Spirochaetia bacterium]|nr:hypothetical protein AGMMS50293_28700 [Spirochaetia bacterium]